MYMIITESSGPPYVNSTSIIRKIGECMNKVCYMFLEPTSTKQWDKHLQTIISLSLTWVTTQLKQTKQPYLNKMHIEMNHEFYNTCTYFAKIRNTKIKE